MVEGPQKHMQEIVSFGSLATIPVVFKLIQCSCHFIVKLCKAVEVVVYFLMYG